MEPLVSLAIANAAFVGSHFAMSHPLRAAMVACLGEKGFAAVYSLVSLALFAWIVIAFRQCGSMPLEFAGLTDLVWVIASLLTVVSTALLIGSLRGNPALPQTDAGTVAAARSEGAFAVTRHPMMWAIAIWALAHVLVWPSPRTLVTASAMGILALVGAHLQDRKKRVLLGEAWSDWEARTRYWPNLLRLGRIGWPVWIVAIGVGMVFTGLHQWLAGIPAGLWRWMG